MTQSEAKKRCKQLFIDRWGHDWITARDDTFCAWWDEYPEGDLFHVGIAQADDANDPAPDGGLWMSDSIDGWDHMMEFECNLRTGDIKITTDY